jgi:hypothetical protein
MGADGDDGAVDNFLQADAASLFVVVVVVSLCFEFFRFKQL